MARLTQLTREQNEDLTLLAEALEANEANGKLIRNLGNKYKDFIDEHFEELAGGIKVGKLYLSLKLTTKLIASKIK